MADFARRHYAKVAGILHRQGKEVNPDRFTLLIADFADMFAADNPNFSRDRFEEACRTGKGAA